MISRFHLPFVLIAIIGMGACTDQQQQNEQPEVLTMDYDSVILWLNNGDGQLRLRDIEKHLGKGEKTGAHTRSFPLTAVAGFPGFPVNGQTVFTGVTIKFRDSIMLQKEWHWIDATGPLE
jgi:hypothetical protein